MTTYTLTRGLSVIALLLSVVSSRLVVYGPQELKDKFDYSGNSQLYLL